MSRQRLEILPVTGLPEVAEGTDLGSLISAATELRDGDVLAVTSKIVSKAEGRLLTGVSRSDAVEREMVRLVARRGETRIVQTRQGLVLAAAGVDSSNTAPGTVLLLPVDPDASARRIRTAIAANVGVVITDTLGRPWRNGQVDLAIGAAGIRVVDDLRGSTDSHGNTLEVTLTALADEIAAAGELVKGKTSGIPVAVLRGLADLVLPAGEHGPGARALIRDSSEDLFSLGTREAAIAAVTERRRPVAPRELVGLERFIARAALDDVKITAGNGAFTVEAADPVAVGRVAERLAVLLHAEGYGVSVETADSAATVTFGSPF